MEYNQNILAYTDRRKHPVDKPEVQFICKEMDC